VASSVKFLQSFQTNQKVLTSSVKRKFTDPLCRVQYQSLLNLEDRSDW